MEYRGHLDEPRRDWSKSTDTASLPHVLRVCISNHQNNNKPRHQTTVSFSLLVIYPLVYINLFSLCRVSGSVHTTNSLLQNSTMSFLSGAECSTAGNPLSQFTKHVQDDKSLQRDRLVGRGPGGLQEGMRSQVIGGGQDNVSLYIVCITGTLRSSLPDFDTFCCRENFKEAREANLDIAR